MTASRCALADLDGQAEQPFAQRRIAWRVLRAQQRREDAQEQRANGCASLHRTSREAGNDRELRTISEEPSQCLSSNAFAASDSTVACALGSTSLRRLAAREHKSSQHSLETTQLTIQQPFDLQQDAVREVVRDAAVRARRQRADQLGHELRQLIRRNHRHNR